MNDGRRKRQMALLLPEAATPLAEEVSAAAVRTVVKQIVSGGQTGVDRTALDVAIELGIVHGGWCPRGRTAEDGRIPDRYELTECEDSDYRQRTEKNVLDSDGTLILYREPLTGGTRLTRRFARQHAKPYLLGDFACGVAVADVRRWIVQRQVQRLNVAGPRESSRPGIGCEVQGFLRKLLCDDR